MAFYNSAPKGAELFFFTQLYLNEEIFINLLQFIQKMLIYTYLLFVSRKQSVRIPKAYRTDP